MIVIRRIALDWKTLFAFEQVEGGRREAQDSRIASRLGERVGVKDGLKIGTRLGAKIGAKPGAKF